MKSAVTAVLLLFVAGSIVFLVVSETRKPTDSTTPAAPTAAPGLPGQEILKTESDVPDPADARRAGTVVYYFHGTMRCPTCLRMERYAREAVEQNLGAEIDAGLVEWHSVNYDEPANEHFLKEYGLTASALVIVSQAQSGADSWRNLDRIWGLVSDETAFRAYVVEEVTAMMRGES